MLEYLRNVFARLKSLSKSKSKRDTSNTANYSFVRDESGNVQGLWLQTPKDAENPDLLCFLLLKHETASQFITPIQRGQYRVEPNNVDGRGGCFVIFASAHSSNKKAERSAGAVLTMEDKTYEAAATRSAYGANVVAKKRCFILTTYQDFTATYAIAGRALKDAGRDTQLDYNYQRHLRVVCANCQSGLTPEGIGMLLLSQVTSVTEKPLIVNMQPAKGCRKCGLPNCYIVYDPEGFLQPRSEMAYYFVYADLSRAKQGFDLIKERVSLKRSGLDVHGVLEFRTDTQAAADDLPFPHWVVIHAKNVTPDRVLDRFMDPLGLALEELKISDHDVLRSADSIRRNQERSKLHESVDF